MKTWLTSPVLERGSICITCTVTGLFTYSSQINADLLGWIGITQLRLRCSSCKQAQTIFTWSLLGFAIDTDMGTWSSGVRCGTKSWLSCAELHAVLAVHLGVQTAR